MELMQAASAAAATNIPARQSTDIVSGQCLPRFLLCPSRWTGEGKESEWKEYKLEADQLLKTSNFIGQLLFVISKVIVIGVIDYIDVIDYSHVLHKNQATLNQIAHIHATSKSATPK